MQIQEIYRLFLAHSVVTTDSRNIPLGSLFFSLKGNSFNGNTFASKAIEQGCSYAFVDEEEYAGQERIIYVEDCLKALQQLANYHRRQFKGKVIGITGTNGKTTTKELIAAVLSKKYNILYTQGNLNNHIGVPMTLLQLKEDHELAVIEMGANHCGEIQELCAIAEPDFGLITNVGRGHLEGFGSFEGVLRTKGELYEAIRRVNGTVFLHHENLYLQELSKGMKKIEYGESPGLYVQGTECTSDPFLSFKWALQDGETQQVTTHLVGTYNLENALAAIAVGRYFDISSDLIQEAIQEYIPQNNRSQYKKGVRNSLIIDAYNANPTSMLASLKNFSEMKVPAKAVVLGDMLELGEESKAEHRKMIVEIEKAGFKEVFLIGNEFSSIEHPFHYYGDTKAFIEYLKEHPLSGFTILIKGSRKWKLEEIIPYL
ncbi:MAG: UDP-N-acetylmuramoyl-tripeptide--D-alanyl-D-alanine ligase [Candidatus Azobacteroides sp.]|nr:UDP-N-acetylmuramoyl-tripeptide--D-alanyl-D-alanine ligase [Candidatus Azobacteroides sp.]